MNIVVQKFGGTSVADHKDRRRAVQCVLQAVQQGESPVVVVSAMGRSGDPYATDTLVQLMQAEGDTLCERELDMLMACGELISSAIVAQAITAAGHRAVALSGGQAGIITDDSFGEAKILEVRSQRLIELIQSGRIPVVAGFQGATLQGDITTLGRGGSDTTATALAVALKAKRVEIYTDVAGIMTADPRLEPRARRLDSLTYQEVAELAHLGAKVVHPRAVEIAAEGDIPIYVRSLYSDDPGTVIASRRSQPIPIYSDKVVTGIAHVSNLAHVEIYTDGDFNDGLAIRLFEAVAGANISIDVIYMSPTLIAFNVHDSQADDLVEILQGLGLSGQFTVETGYAKVSAVGAGMRGVPGVMYRIVNALHRYGCSVFQTTDSHANISCLVKESRIQDAVRALHEEFELGM